MTNDQLSFNAQKENAIQKAFLNQYKIGFLGAGHMTQALIKGMIESKTVKSNKIYVSNRTPGKLLKLKELYHEINTVDHNENLINDCDIIVLSTKPQDLPTALESLNSMFNDKQIVVSLAAGIPAQQLSKMIPHARIARLMPNTPSLIGRGVLGLLTAKKDEATSALLKDLFCSLGTVIEVDSEDQFDALMVSCSSGTGFIFEMMLYWQDWIIERGFSEEQARLMTIETFLGTSLLASQSKGIEVEELQQRVTSKKGVTLAGLQSMRELEIERALRVSFEKAALRSQEISRGK